MVPAGHFLQGYIGGAIDGWLLPTQVPLASLVGNVKTYFLGHYQHHRFKIQAIVVHLGWLLLATIIDLTRTLSYELSVVSNK
jgi:hypothetical protein